MRNLPTYENFIIEGVTFDTETTGRKDWDDDLKKYKSRFTQLIITMSPDEFLNRVQHHRFTVDKKKVAEYVKEFRRGAKDVPAPTMWFSDKFQYDKGLAPSFHDGSHRMLALQEIGIREVPVKIIY